MAFEEFDAAAGYSFGLEFDSVRIMHIQEASGLKMEQDVIELKQNSQQGHYVPKKLPGRPKNGEITLTRGLTADNSFHDWVKHSQFGKMANARKGGSIILFDHEGTEVKRYKLHNAWPKALEIGALKAGDTSVLTEKLTITHEGLEVD